jgi:hypothetical protein
MTVDDLLSAALRDVIEGDAVRVLVPPVSDIRRRSRRRRRETLAGSAVLGVAAAVAAFAVAGTLTSSGPRGAVVADGGGTPAPANAHPTAVEVREVLEVREPAQGGQPLTAAAAYDPAMFAAASCGAKQPLGSGGPLPTGEVMSCALDSSELFRLGPVAIPDADFAHADASGNNLSLNLTADGLQRLRTLTAANVNKMIAFVADGVVVSAPTVQAEVQQATLTLSDPALAGKLAADINAGR